MADLRPPAPVPAPFPRPSRRRWRACTLAVAVALALGACSSGGSDDATQVDVGRQRLERRNQRYLEQTVGWKASQAKCVARRLDIDLTVLLDGAQGDDPTRKAGFQAFAAAVKVCIPKDPRTPTTTR